MARPCRNVKLEKSPHDREIGHGIELGWERPAEAGGRVGGTQNVLTYASGRLLCSASQRGMAAEPRARAWCNWRA